MKPQRERSNLEVFLLLVAHMGKKDFFGFPMNVGWGIKIRYTHIQNAISLMFSDRWYESSAGKVLKIILEFVMALDE